MNVFDYIENWCKNRGYNNYYFKNKVITKEMFSNNFTFAPGIAFFYRVVACGQILNLSDFSNHFLTVQTPQDYFDFSKICTFADYGTMQRATADFIFPCTNTMKIQYSEGAGALFNTVQTAQLFYMYVIPVKDKKSDNNNSLEIDIIK